MHTSTFGNHSSLRFSSIESSSPPRNKSDNVHRIDGSIVSIRVRHDRVSRGSSRKIESAAPAVQVAFDATDEARFRLLAVAPASAAMVVEMAVWTLSREGWARAVELKLGEAVRWFGRWDETGEVAGFGVVSELLVVFDWVSSLSEAKDDARGDWAISKSEGVRGGEVEEWERVEGDSDRSSAVMVSPALSFRLVP
jgi:hypothetical protein